MVLGRTNPHAVGRAAALGVLALAALVLGLAAGTGRGDEEEQQGPPGKGRFGGKSGKGDAQQIEKELKRKLEEVERLKKQLEESRKGDKKGGSIRVEISGANREEIQKATAALKRALPGKDVHVSGGPEAKHRPEMHGGPWFGRRGFWGEQPKASPRTETRPSSVDARLDGLEKKLSEIGKELEALRKEIRGAESKDKGRGPAGKGGFGPRRSD